MFEIANAQQSQAVTAAFSTAIAPIITNVVNPIIELAFAVALVVFAYGVIQMMLHDADADAHKNGRRSMIWGIVGLVIMSGAWGIIYLVANTVKTF